MRRVVLRAPSRLLASLGAVHVAARPASSQGKAAVDAADAEGHDGDAAPSKPPKGVRPPEAAAPAKKSSSASGDSARGTGGDKKLKSPVTRVSARGARNQEGMDRYLGGDDAEAIRAAHKKFAHLKPTAATRLKGWGTVALEVAPLLTTFTFGIGSVVGVAMTGVPHWATVGQFFALFTATQRLLCRGIASPSAKSDGTRDMKGKVCLITGASSGIGLITAAKLLDAGATVIATHNTVSAEETKDRILQAVIPDTKEALEGEKMSQLIVWPLRLEERSTITRLGNSVKKQFPDGIDVLVNNAGNMMSEDLVVTNGLEKTIDVSFVGPYALTETLLPLIHKKDGRVVFLSSHQHRIVTTRDEPDKMISRTVGYRHTGDDDMRYHRSRQFSQAKFGNTCHAWALHKRGVKACAVNPGRSNTLLRRNVFPMLGTRYYWPAVMWGLRTPEEGAQSVIYACIQSDEDYVSGGYYYNCKARAHGMSPFVSMAAEAACDWAARESKVPVTRLNARKRATAPASKSKDSPKAATIKRKGAEE